MHPEQRPWQAASGPLEHGYLGKMMTVSARRAGPWQFQTGLAAENEGDTSRDSELGQTMYNLHSKSVAVASCSIASGFQFQRM
jgi:hypothetical protein